MHKIKFVFVSFILFLSSAGSSQNQSPAVLLNPSSYDFGTVRRGAKVEGSLMIINHQDSDLIIQGMNLSISGLRIKAPQTIPKGQEVKILFELDTAALLGDVDGKAVLFTNNPQSPAVQLQIKGKVESSIALEPDPPIFLSAFRWEVQQKESTISIVNKEQTPLKILNLETEGDAFTPRLTASEEGRRYQISIKINSKAEPGKAEGRITIVTDKERLKIPVYTFLKEKVYLVPDHVDLGRIDLEQIDTEPGLLEYRKQSIFLYQYHGKDFQIQIQSVPEFLSIEKTPAQGAGSVIEIPKQGSTAVFELAVSPVKKSLKRGKFQESIRLTTNDPEFPVLEIPVYLEVI